MMPEADPLVNALKLTGGARFHKCALQINPHHYAMTFRGRPAQGDAETHAREIVERALSLGISVLAITDHNHVGSIPLFRDVAKDFAIHVFPGFELSSSEGVHVLCIYPPDTDEDRLGRYLGEFGIRTTDPSLEQSNKTFTEILRCVREQGGGDYRSSRNKRRRSVYSPERTGQNPRLEGRKPPCRSDSGVGRGPAPGVPVNHREQERRLPSRPRDRQRARRRSGERP